MSVVARAQYQFPVLFGNNLRHQQDSPRWPPLSDGFAETWPKVHESELARVWPNAVISVQTSNGHRLVELGYPDKSYAQPPSHFPRAYIFLEMLNIPPPLLTTHILAAGKSPQDKAGTAIAISFFIIFLPFVSGIPLLRRGGPEGAGVVAKTGAAYNKHHPVIFLFAGVCDPCKNATPPKEGNTLSGIWRSGGLMNHIMNDSVRIARERPPDHSGVWRKKKALPGPNFMRG